MRRVVLAVVGTITGLIMLLSFKTHAATSAAPEAPSTAGNDATGAGDGSATTSPGATTPASPTSGGVTKTVTGNESDTRYGPVQVQVTITNGQLSAVNAVEYPQNDPRDQQINSYAIPQLNSEALAAKSAKIDMVSGATYTSSGYIDSLQSALDQAGI